MASPSEERGLTQEELLNCLAEPDESTTDFIFQQTMYRIQDPKSSLDFYSRILGMRLLKKLDFPDMKFSLYFMGFAKADDIPTQESEKTRWCFSQKATLELTHNWGTENDDTFKGYHNGNSEPRGFEKNRKMEKMNENKGGVDGEQQTFEISEEQAKLLEIFENSGISLDTLLDQARQMTQGEEESNFEESVDHSEEWQNEGHIGVMVPDVEKACQRFEDLGVKFIKRPNDGKMKGLAFIQDPDGYWIEIFNADNMASM